MALLQLVKVLEITGFVHRSDCRAAMKSFFLPACIIMLLSL